MKRQMPDESCFVNHIGKDSLNPASNDSFRHLNSLSYSINNQSKLRNKHLNALTKGIADERTPPNLRQKRLANLPSERKPILRPSDPLDHRLDAESSLNPQNRLNGGHSSNAVHCCTLPQLTTSFTRPGDSPSLGGSRSLLTACAQRYLPKTHRVVSPVADDAVVAAAHTVAVSDSLPRGNRAKQKCIFVSYSPDCRFDERRLVSDIVAQFKDNDMADDIWFDADEGVIGKPCWLSSRIEAVESCTAALVFFSPAYFESSTCIYEARTLLARLSRDDDRVSVFSVVYELHMGMPDNYKRLVSSDDRLADLTIGEQRDRAHAELCNFVIGYFCIDLQKYANIHAASPGYVPPSSNNVYKIRPIRAWTVDDVQDWLQSLSVREFYRQSFEELKVDGNLLISLTDLDLSHHLAIESRAARKKILRQMLCILEKEFKYNDAWHLRARSMRTKPNSIYIIYDPSDVRIAQSFKGDMIRRQIQVMHHQKLGQTKEEFLKLNCLQLATCSFVVVILTEASCQSAFVFHELLFADWLNKKLVTAVYHNVWTKLRCSLKAVLGDAIAIDFETCKYEESLEALDSLIRPSRSFAGVVLEQSYLSQMNESIKTLSSFAKTNKLLSEDVTYSVYISYHWDSQTKVQFIKDILSSAGISCWSNTMECPLMTTTSPGGLQPLKEDPHKYFKCAQLLIVALTAKHVQSDACYRDLYYADANHKPMIVIILRTGTCWPPDATSASPQTRRLLSKRYAVIDMSTDKLLRHNRRMLLERVKRVTVTDK